MNYETLTRTGLRNGKEGPLATAASFLVPLGRQHVLVSCTGQFEPILMIGGIEDYGKSILRVWGWSQGPRGLNTGGRLKAGCGVEQISHRAVDHL